MREAPYLAALLGLTLGVFPPHTAAAQQFDANGVIYEAARNRIGLMRYCRNNNALDKATAEKAVKAIEAGLLTLPPENELMRELGDRAEEAGEEGFLDVVRRRDIAGFAQGFRTTRTGLCQEWAEETLRALEPRRPGRRVSIATAEPTRANRTIVPPVPAKAPFRLAEAKGAFPQTTTTAARLGHNPSSPHIVHTAAPLSNKTAERPLPVRGTAACLSSADHRCTLLYSLGEKWRNLFGKP